MDILSILKLIAGAAGWPVVTGIAILGCGVALWVKNQRLEFLKEQNETLTKQLEEKEQSSPTALLERIANRNKLLNEEFEFLNNDLKANEKRIKEIEKEKETIEKELEEISAKLCESLRYCKFKCHFCFLPPLPEEEIKIPIVKDGEKLLVNLYAKCPNCGHKIMKITERNNTDDLGIK